ncbi:MAG: hypothetical protein PHV68_01090 [Candidatus Gastranaerophilales bacterium]|nr:hypothetical protein [Candidatus Gastranaerophilales bacterium]
MKNCTPDYNIENIFGLSCQNIDYDELIDYLKSDDSNLQLLALLKLDTIKSSQDADFIVSLLNVPNSRTRELTSVTLQKLLSKQELFIFFDNESFYSTVIETIKDINPNVCRNVIEFLQYFPDKKFALNKIVQNTNEILNLLESQKNKKGHVYKKTEFHLYWNLKAINYLLEKFEFDFKPENIIKLLETTAQNPDYTLREQTAFIISNLKNCCEKVNEIKQKLLLDENFYVKKALY